MAVSVGNSWASPDHNARSQGGRLAGGPMITSAPKQSPLSFLLFHGLLRGACHRARIRATRWLARTEAFNLSPAKCRAHPAASCPPHGSRNRRDVLLL